MTDRIVNLLALVAWLAAMVGIFWILVTHVDAVLMILGALIVIGVLITAWLRWLNT